MFFDLAGVEWEYEPDQSIQGWWPDFRVCGVHVDDVAYNVLAEVKPGRFSPILIDPAFNKALHPKWTLLLSEPDGDYVGVLACKREGKLQTIGVRLTDERLEAAPLGLREYGSHAERLWGKAELDLPQAGVSIAINRIIERHMGKRLFHFSERKADG